MKSGKHLGIVPPIDFESEYGLTAPQGIQLASYSLLLFRHFEDQYFSDLPATDQLALESQIRTILAHPAMLKFWEMSKQQFDDGFQGFMDNLARHIPSPFSEVGTG